MQLIINESISKSHQNLVHYLSRHAVRRTAYLIYAMVVCLKSLASGPMSLASKVQALALTVEASILALALRFWL